MNDVHMLQSKHPVFQSLWSHWSTLQFLSVDASSSLSPTQSWELFLGCQWASLLPLTAQSQPLDTLRWSIITSKEGSPSFSSLCSLILFFAHLDVFRAQHACSFPVHHCTAMIWPHPWYTGAAHGSSCFLCFVCFIMGISVCSWFRWQAHVCRSKITSHSISGSSLTPWI